jgi:hypothetical protein
MGYLQFGETGVKMSVEDAEHVGGLEYVFQVPASAAGYDFGGGGDLALSDQGVEARFADIQQPSGVPRRERELHDLLRSGRRPSSEPPKEGRKTAPYWQ